MLNQFALMQLMADYIANEEDNTLCLLSYVLHSKNAWKQQLCRELFVEKIQLFHENEGKDSVRPKTSIVWCKTLP